MRFAYADPPYIGQARKHYKGHADFGGEVDHLDLLRQLSEFDGWALSASAPSLQELLPMCPKGVRVMPWVKPFCAFKKNVNPAYAWEPVIVKLGRRRTAKQVTVRDWVAECITLQKGLSGAKPIGFCYWLFDVLNIQPEDSLQDLFPGTGVVSRALELWRSTETLVEERRREAMLVPLELRV